MLTAPKPRLPKPKSNNEQLLLGLRWDNEGVLWDPALQRHVLPISHTAVDWCHAFVVGGIDNEDMWLFLKEAREKTHIWFGDLDEFMKGFTWPRCCRNVPKDCFNQARACACNEANTFKCGDSEFLDMYLVFRFFVKSTNSFSTAMPVQTASLEAMFRVLDLLLLGSASRQDSRRLERAMLSAMRLHQQRIKIMF
jgi:hypothetical protein